MAGDRRRRETNGKKIRLDHNQTEIGFLQEAAEELICPLITRMGFSGLRSHRSA